MITVLFDLQEFKEFKKTKISYFNVVKNYLEQTFNTKVELYPILPKSKKFEAFEKQFLKIINVLKNSEIIVCFGSSAKIFYPYEDIFKEFGIYRVKKSNDVFYLITLPPSVYFIDKDASWGFHHLVWFLKKIDYKNLQKNYDKLIKINIPLKKQTCEIVNLGINDIKKDVEEFFILTEKDSEYINQLKSEMFDSKVIALDTEFYDISGENNKDNRIYWHNHNFQIFLVSIVLRNRIGKICSYVIYYPLFKNILLEIVKRWLENGNILTGLNIRLDLLLLFRDLYNFNKRKFVEWIKVYFENLNIIDLRHFLLAEDNSKTKGVSLKSLSAFYLQYPHYEHLIDYDKNYGLEFLKFFTKKKFSENDLRKNFQSLLSYSSYDSIVAYKLYKLFEKNLNNKEILALLKKQSRLLFYIEYLGVNIDLSELKKREQFIENYIKDIEEFYCKYIGIKNMNSNKQLQEGFKKIAQKDTLKLLNKTPTGQYSFRYQDIDFILKNYYDKLNDDEKIFFEYLYKYKIINHLKETFYNSKKFEKFIDNVNNYIHPEFTEFSINSGRITTKNPCIAQIPGEKNVISSVGKSEFKEYVQVGNVREIFIPDNKEHFLVEIDLSQADVRLAYLLSQDPQLYKDLHSDDLYISLYSTFFDKDKSKVSKAERQFIKIIILGLLYGLKPTGILRQLKTIGNEIDLQSIFPDKDIFSLEFAEYIYNLFQKKYKVYVHNYLRKINEFVLYKRKLDIIRNRVFNAIYFINNKDILREILINKYDILNTANNFPIQGFTNDVIFIMAYNIQKEMLKKNIDGRIINLIYDAFLISLNKKEWKNFVDILQNLLYIIDKEQEYFSWIAKKVSLFLNQKVVVFPFFGFEVKIGKSWGNILAEIKIKNENDFNKLYEVNILDILNT